MARRVQAETPARAEDKKSLSGPRESSADTAVYIAQMSAELASLASAAGLTMLAYFLNLAHVEAQINARDHGDRGPAADP